jgi:hypothetical protein
MAGDVGVPVPQPTQTRSAAGQSSWLHWSITVGSIALPILVLLVVYSIPKDSFAWHEVNVSIERGVFLIPVLIMCLDVIRRWWFDVRCGRVLLVVRIIATILCAFAAIVCLVATTAAANEAVTPASGRSITVITWWCLGVAFTFGTLAVSSPAKQGE